jgi:hypothetical protein
MCFYNYTDSPSQSLFHAVHVEVFKDLLLKKGLRLSFPKESSDFYKEPLIMGHLMGFGVPTSSSLLCSKANSTVGTANWLAKKLTSPGNCEELTFGPGQFPPRMQLSSCLCGGAAARGLGGLWSLQRASTRMGWETGRNSREIWMIGGDGDTEIEST